jgi:RNA polymerase sigma-70 factor (ECF subfamily)
MRENLFDLSFPLAQRAAKVRAASAKLSRADFDREDLEQEALIGVWSALDRFDVSRASIRTFVERVVANSIASIIRRSRSDKRAPRDDDRFHGESPRFSLTIEVRLDLDRLIANLGRRDRKVARLLEEYRPAEIARALKISRTAVYRSIERIREVFSEAGFR